MSAVLSLFPLAAVNFTLTSFAFKLIQVVDNVHQNLLE